jgi:hypothetical protein
MFIHPGGALRPVSVVRSIWRQLEWHIQLRFQDSATVYGHSQRHRRLLRAKPILQSGPRGKARQGSEASLLRFVLRPRIWWLFQPILFLQRLRAAAQSIQYPLYLRQQTYAVQQPMSAKCQKQTSASIRLIRPLARLAYWGR